MFGGLPVAARLWLAALLVAAAHQLLVTYVQNPGTLTPGHVGPMICDYQGFCTVGSYYPGIFIPGTITPVTPVIEAQAFLVLAALLLLVVALQRRTAATQRLARVAAGAVAIALVLSAAQGRAVTVLGAALLLIAPPAWRPIRMPALP